MPSDNLQAAQMSPITAIEIEAGRRLADWLRERGDTNYGALVDRLTSAASVKESAPKTVKVPELTEEQRAYLTKAVRREPVDMDIVIGGQKAASQTVKEEVKPAASVMEAMPSDDPGPFSRLVEQEWQTLLDKDDRTSPVEYPEMCLITRVELAGAMSEAFFDGTDKGRSSAAPSPPEARREEIARIIDPDIFRSIDSQAGFPPESIENYQNRCVAAAFAKADAILTTLKNEEGRDA